MGLLLGRERPFSVEKSDVEHHKREHMSKHKAYVWSTTDKFMNIWNKLVVRHPSPKPLPFSAGGGDISPQGGL